MCYFSDGIAEDGNCVSSDNKPLSTSDDDVTLLSCKQRCVNNDDCKMFSYGDINPSELACIHYAGNYNHTDQSDVWMQYDYKCYILEGSLFSTNR